MAKRFFGSIDLQTNSSVLFRETDNTSAVTLKGPASLATDLTITLPGTVTADGVLKTDGSGNLSSALILNANIDAAAAIGLSKLAALTADRLLVSDGSGVISVSAATATEAGYLSGVTSAIQTQIDGKAGRALDNLTVASLAAEALLVGSSSSAVASLPVGTEGQVLKVVSGAVAWAADAGTVSYKEDWVTGDGTSKTVTHSLSSLDVIVQIYDKATGETIEVDEVERTSTSVVTLTASEAPGASGWRVMVLAV